MPLSIGLPQHPVLKVGVSLSILIPFTALHAAEVDVSKLPPTSKVTVDFDRDIRPIFEKSCLKCHGTERPRSGFSLASRELALKGGDSGVAIIPGQSAQSKMIHFVGGLVEDMEMPPPGKADPVPADQLALLRAWIDQGAKWSETGAKPVTVFSITPSVRFISVSGNKGAFREHTGLKDDWVGGAQDFYFEERRKPGEKFTVEGRGLFDARDYLLKLSLEKNNLGFARAGFEQYQRYYNEVGGFYAPFATNSFSAGRDLTVDVGRAWVEFGLTLPRWPRMTLGYEHQFKEGAKSSLTWNDVYFDLAGPNPALRSIYPASKGIDEKAHIIKFDLTHEIVGVAVEDNLRIEFFDLENTRAVQDPITLGEPLPNSATAAREDYRHFQAVNTLRAEKEIRDWLFISGGYLYSKLDADAAFSLTSFAPTEPSVALFALDQSNPITIERQSHIFNANTRLGPWENLVLTVGLQNEWTHEEGFGRGLQTPNSHAYSSQRDKAVLEEDVGLRYTGIPYTVFYMDGRFQQEWTDHYEKDEFSVENTDFLRDTDARSDLFLYRTGFTISPWRKVMFETNYRHRLKQSNYRDVTDYTAPDRGSGEYFGGDFAGNGYPAFIRARDVELDEIEFKLTLHPLAWLKTTLKYQRVATDFRTVTDPNNVTLFDPVTFLPIASPQPGGRIFSGNYDAHVYSLNATLTPWRRLFLSTTFSYSDSRTGSGVDGRAGVTTYEGDIYSVLASGNFIINDKTDWNASYTFSRGDYEQPGAALPLGIAYERHGVLTGLARRFKKNISTHLQYGFFSYDEPSAGGANDYTAHLVLGMVTLNLK